jgi:putative transposase
MNQPAQRLPTNVQLFDRDAEVHVLQRRLPHWSQAGALCFITWRTHDSMPKAVVDDWNAERMRGLARLGIDPNDPNWRQRVTALMPHAEREDHGSPYASREGPLLPRVFLDQLSSRWHDALDACHGDCVLRRPELAKIVADSLSHFDDQRYALFDFVIMPNHIHLLASFANEDEMTDQCESWKHFTATRINRLLGRKSRFWQQDAFDHLVRTEEQFAYLRLYIADNPTKAKLRPGEFIHYSRSLAPETSRSA